MSPPETALWAFSSVSLQGYLLILESQHLKRGLPPAWLARLLGHFLRFLCLFILWPVFSLTCLFFSTLLWGEITFSGLNSHLIRFIFNQPLYPFVPASYFHEPSLPSFLSVSGFLRRWEENVWLQHVAPGFYDPRAAAQGAGNLAQL